MGERLLFRPVLAFARLAFTDLLAYRLRYIVGVLNYTIYMAAQYFLWSAVFSSAPSSSVQIGSFRLRELITYFAIGWIVRVSYYNNVDRELADRVIQGDIAMDLLRPISLLKSYYGRALGEASFRLFFMGLPTALVLFPLFAVERPSWPDTIAAAIPTAAAFMLSIVLAFHAFFLINFLVGATAIFFEKIRGVLWAKFVLLQFLSGLLVPFDLFPTWARLILECLPFRAIIYSPVTIYLGRVQGEGLVKELAFQAAWVVLLYFIAQWFWRRGQKKLLVMGG